MYKHRRKTCSRFSEAGSDRFRSLFLLVKQLQEIIIIVITTTYIVMCGSQITDLTTNRCFDYGLSDEKVSGHCL